MFVQEAQYYTSVHRLPLYGLSRGCKMYMKSCNHITAEEIYLFYVAIKIRQLKCHGGVGVEIDIEHLGH